jgi:LAO/AO transport system kinase
MSEQAAKILAGDARALARAATGVENRDPIALDLLRELAPSAGRARVVGITGPPGAGKSTLVDAVAAVLRARGRTVAILAVDPSSRATGGAILGDRIRMQRHHADAGIFIRSMATRGSLGGLARATADLAMLMDAAGRDWVLIETVGVGQGEIEIAGLAQVTVVVLVPGMGDDVQTIKAGIMEIADVFVVNKADLPGADRVERELQGMLGLAEGRTVPIVRTSAASGEGVEELVGTIEGVGRARRPAAAAPEFQLDRIGIAVPDLAAALGFWRDQLGMAVVGETGQSEKVNLALMPAGGPRIEIRASASPGLHHIALRVPDLAGLVDRMRAAGVRLVGEPDRLHVFVDPASTGGVLLELIQDH